MLTGESGDNGRPAPAGVRVERVTEYESPDALARLFELCSEAPPDRIIINSERDVLRAAEARSLFGVHGMTSDVAVMFRDKVRMKELLAGCGLPVVPYRAVRCVGDVLAARREFGAIVVKPRDGVGSVGVHVLRSGPELLDALRSDPALVLALSSGTLMVEKYIEGAVFHVDVIVGADGAPVLVSPSRYTVPPHRFRTENLGSVMLDEGDGTFRALDAAAREFVAALPGGCGATALHIEFLADPQGRLHAGEVAARIGGALVKDSIRFSFGVDISQMSCLISAGITPSVPELSRKGPQVGWIIQNGGPELSFPADSPDWVLHQEMPGRAGAARNSVDAAARFVVAGEDEKVIVDRMKQLSRAV
ncbi:hypothetical protein Afe05nite_25410 [Paractinoplanes ferrugineus]|uniref:ATP-grasp domain-containing protein n=1 Tax=Paractinoplanes ferrugineus TaxID=113564 RepID=A0A919J502_9ACTN|nr:hypothetical protein Afe05nite_25410 [Actinoplanes ferrugineus]